jgi:hypothetical protein
MWDGETSLNFYNSKKRPAKKGAGALRRRHSARARHSRAENKRVLCIVHYLLNKTGFLFLTALIEIL